MTLREFATGVASRLPIRVAPELAPPVEGVPYAGEGWILNLADGLVVSIGEATPPYFSWGLAHPMGRASGDGETVTEVARGITDAVGSLDLDAGVLSEHERRAAACAAAWAEFDAAPSTEAACAVADGVL